MAPKILTFVATAGALILAVLIGALLGQSNFLIGLLVLVGFLATGSLLALGRGASLISKLLALAIFFYFAAGRGFAHLTPFPPLYPGEFILAACLALYVVDLVWKRVDSLGPSAIIAPLLCIVVCSAVQLVLVDFKAYRLLALRDFAMVYYGAFFVVAYQAFRSARSREFFFKAALAGASLLLVYQVLEAARIPVREYTVSVRVFGQPIYYPHPDVIGPAITFLASYCLLLGAHKRQLFLIFIGALGLVSLIIIFKSSYLLCVLGFGLLMLIAGRGRQILQLGMIGTVVAALMLSLLVIPSDLSDQIIEKAEAEMSSLNPAEFNPGTSGAQTTTQWRLVWWQTIIKLVHSENPLFGLGFGSDISTPFFVKYYGGSQIFRAEDGSLPRYPHSILFTALGRNGYVGVILWSWLVLSVGYVTIRWAKRSRARGARDVALLAGCTYVVAALLNSLVQSTFEAPFAAIPFWVILAWTARQAESVQDAGVPVDLAERDGRSPELFTHAKPVAG